MTLGIGQKLIYFNMKKFYTAYFFLCPTEVWYLISISGIKMEKRVDIFLYIILILKKKNVICLNTLNQVKIH